MKLDARTLLLSCGVALLAFTAAASVGMSARTPTTATLSIDPRLAGRHLTIIGATDLPDGTEVLWSVWNESEAERFVNLEEAVDQSIYGHAVVSGGKFVASADLSGWPAGSTMVWAAFDPSPDQPAETIARVGEWGERLSGPGVIDDSGYPRLVSSTTIDLPGG
jgi:hypothetical protein